MLARERGNGGIDAWQVGRSVGWSISWVQVKLHHWILSCALIGDRPSLGWVSSRMNRKLQYHRPGRCSYVAQDGFCFFFVVCKTTIGVCYGEQGPMYSGAASQGAASL